MKLEPIRNGYLTDGRTETIFNFLANDCRKHAKPVYERAFFTEPENKQGTYFFYHAYTCRAFIIILIVIISPRV